MSSRAGTSPVLGLRSPHPFRRHQDEALDALEHARARGRRRAWVVLPPGAGKTLVGLETARRRGTRTVAFGPNTAIQAQWARSWDAFLPAPDHPARAGTDRSLTSFFTALTYQSLASFLPDDEVDEEGHRHSMLARLHPNGRALVDRLRGEPELTIILDECHHLLEVWGKLLAELLAELPNAYVLGLTATPPATLTTAQATLVDDLFGGIVYQASIPAVVREGHLAPFAELAWLTTPTPTETDYITSQADRFAELVHGLTDPTFGSVPFLAWVDRRFVAGCDSAVTWHRLATDTPALADAALRLHHHGLLARPAGARLLEQHRQPPTAEDWVALIDDWGRHHLLRSGHPADEAVLDTIRRTLPAVGYTWTRRGIRRGSSPVDRVLARSAAKTDALVDIVTLENSNLGTRMRMLVLCDHERAAAVLPVDLHGVMPAEAGSAQLALERLAADQVTGSLGPLLVTGSRVTASVEALEELRAFIATTDPGLAGRLTVTPDPSPGTGPALGTLTGPWSSRTWVPWVTRFFAAGRTQVLVGTRALLGEGWDAPAVTGLVDLTTATTATAVVQTRGRALRLDPGWPEKVALTWTVVCVTDTHPKGAADWERFVRKHDGFFGVDEEGDVVDGVAHVHDRFSPYAPPPAGELDSCNASMVVRSGQRPLLAERWRVGEPYADTHVHTIRVLPYRPYPQLPAPAAVAVLRPAGLEVRPAVPAPWQPHPVTLVGLLVLLAVPLGLPAAAAVVLAALTGFAAQTAVAASRGRTLLAEVARRPPIARVACAVADAFAATGLSPVGADAVVVEVDADGEYRCALDGVTPEVSARFASSLEEVISPMAAPRYVLPRWVVDPPAPGLAGYRAGLTTARRGVRPTGEVWHSVPAALGGRAESARAFAVAWDRWVGGGEALYTGSPEGEGVLVTHRGSDPFDATTVLRLHWR